MDNKVFQILCELEPHGVAEWVNISPILFKLYPIPDNADRDIKITIWRRIISLLDSMQKEDFINTQPYLNYTSAIAMSSWLDNLQLKASITNYGITIIEIEKNKGGENRLKESLIATNQSIQDTGMATVLNFRFQKIFGIWSLILAACSVLFILATVILQVLDKTPQHLKDIKIEQQRQATALEKIELYLQGKDTSIQHKKK